MALTVGELNVKLGIDTATFDKVLSKVEQQLKSIKINDTMFDGMLKSLQNAKPLFQDLANALLPLSNMAGKITININQIAKTTAQATQATQQQTTATNANSVSQQKAAQDTLAFGRAVAGLLAKMGLSERAMQRLQGAISGYSAVSNHSVNANRALVAAQTQLVGINQQLSARVNASAAAMVKQGQDALRTASGLARLAHVSGDVGRAVQILQQALSRAGSGVNTTPVEIQLRKLQNELHKTGNIATETGRRFEGMGGFIRRALEIGVGNLISGVVYGIANAFEEMFRSAITSAAEFEQSMANVNAILSPTGDQLSALTERARELGRVTEFTATELGAGIEILARNGLDAETILAGVIDATSNLASATGADFSLAADIATDAMTIFRLSADEFADTIDGITGVVNTSKFDINDYRLAIGQISGAAALTGLSFEDMNLAIASTASFFTSGQTAGTAFKTLLLNLNPVTLDARNLMRDLGIITKDGTNQFFDQTGALKDLAGITETLTDAMAGYTQAEITAAMARLFGVDASAAAAAMIQVGSKGLDEYREKIEATSAAETAAKRLDSFQGSVKLLTSAFESLSISMVNLEALRGFIDSVTRGIGLVERFALAMQGNANAFLSFPEPIQRVILTLQRMFGWFSDIASSMFNWGSGAGAAFADGLYDSISYITGALNYIGDVISYWLTPGSPPPLLPHLDQWGEGAAQAYMDGWANADVGALTELATQISDALAGVMETTLSQTDLVSLGDSVAKAISAALEGTEGNLEAAEGALDALNAQMKELKRQERELAIEDEIKKYQRQLKDANPAIRQAAALKLAQLQIEKNILALERQKEAAEVANPTTATGGGGGGGGSRSPALTEAEREAIAAQEAQDRYNYELADTAERLVILRDRLAGVESGSADYYGILLDISKLEQTQAAEQARIADDQARDMEARAEAERDYQFGLEDREGQLDILTDELANAEEGSVDYYRILKEIDGLNADGVKEQEAREQAQRDYNFAIADSAGKLAILTDELADAEVGSVDYYRILGEINSLQEAAAKSAEKAGGAAKRAAQDPLFVAKSLQDRYKFAADEVERLTKEFGWLEEGSDLWVKKAFEVDRAMSNQIGLAKELGLDVSGLTDKQADFNQSVKDTVKELNGTSEGFWGFKLRLKELRDSATESVKPLTDLFNPFAQSIKDKLITPMTEAAQVASEKFNKAFAESSAAFHKDMEPAIETVKGGIKNLTDAIYDFINNPILQEVATNTVKAFGEIATFLTGLSHDTFPSVTAGFGSTIGLLGDIVKLTELIVLDVNKVTDGFSNMSKLFENEELMGKLKNVLGSLMINLTNLGTEYAMFWGMLVANIIDGVGRLFGKEWGIADSTKEIFDAFRDTMAEGIRDFDINVERMGQAFTVILPAMIRHGLTEALKPILGFVESLRVNFENPILQSAFPNISNGLDTLAVNIGGFVDVTQFKLDASGTDFGDWRDIVAYELKTNNDDWRGWSTNTGLAIDGTTVAAITSTRNMSLEMALINAATQSDATTQFNTLKSNVTTAITDAESEGKTAWQRLKEALVTSSTEAKDESAAQIEQLPTKIRTFADMFGGAGRELGDNVGNGILNGITAAQSPIEAEMNNILNGLRNQAQIAIDILNSVTGRNIPMPSVPVGNAPIPAPSAGRSSTTPVAASVTRNEFNINVGANNNVTRSEVQNIVSNEFNRVANKLRRG